MTSLLAVDNISKSFGGLKAVADVSLTVMPGEICSVIGPNGAGKTTLFNMVSGVLRPTAGRIIFNGTDLAGVSPSRFAAIGIGRTFQNLALFKHGTVVENILTGRHTHLRSSVLDAVLFFGRTRAEEIDARRRVEEIIEFLEIEHIRDAIVGTLSYGQQKRVELARALACEPKLLLLDEMVSGMNQEETEDIARFVLDIRDELGITVLMIEHAGSRYELRAQDRGRRAGRSTARSRRCGGLSRRPPRAERRTEGGHRCQRLTVCEPCIRQCQRSKREPRSRRIPVRCGVPYKTQRSQFHNYSAGAPNSMATGSPCARRSMASGTAIPGAIIMRRRGWSRLA